MHAHPDLSGLKDTTLYIVNGVGMAVSFFLLRIVYNLWIVGTRFGVQVSAMPSARSAQRPGRPRQGGRALDHARGHTHAHARIHMRIYRRSSNVDLDAFAVHRLHSDSVGLMCSNRGLVCSSGSPNSEHANQPTNQRSAHMLRFLSMPPKV